jgi:hypothetical protein
VSALLEFLKLLDDTLGHEALTFAQRRWVRLDAPPHLLVKPLELPDLPLPASTGRCEDGCDALEQTARRTMVGGLGRVCGGPDNRTVVMPAVDYPVGLEQPEPQECEWGRAQLCPRVVDTQSLPGRALATTKAPLHSVCGSVRLGLGPITSLIIR